MSAKVPRQHLVVIAAAVAAILGERARVRRVSPASSDAAEATVRPILPPHRSWARAGWRHARAGRSGPWNSWQAEKQPGEAKPGTSRSER